LISVRSAGGGDPPSERELDFLKGVISDRLTKKNVERPQPFMGSSCGSWNEQTQKPKKYVSFIV
jgi:hypothetical protein